ncbi:FAD-binding protein [Hymenobacter sp. BT186]|uniref:FAD-binding protein n=1 Tax=Hymenobacter telluris TaxID=2816474 RepID=A0A939EWA4_9BACT|nr:FAD-binding protein [Hymenobacter telluris]MBO0357800.1 FAD-binding protein [Hymenobacter telluris]MBW3373827.1 FAD-binding protein [Hymenobacter norwichensis]
MSLPNGLEAHPMTEWTNRHENFTQKLTASACFKLRIPALPTSQEQYRQTTANFQWLIRYGIEHNMRLRALGKGWSFSEVAVTNGGLVDTMALRQSFALKPAMVAPAYQTAGRTADNLFFTECGTSIVGLEQLLEPRGKSIRASGASNGQSIAGALSTGTHGGAFRFGAVAETVVGLHLVTGPDRHVWLERASYPVASAKFTDWLGVAPENVHRDDALFNAALVSFGSFGFIHGVLLETEPLFLLEDFSAYRVPYREGVKQLMTNLNLSGLHPWLTLPLTDPSRQPYHLTVIINPHQFDLTGANADHGVFVQLLFKAPYKLPYKRRPAPAPGFTYGDSTLGLIETVLDHLGNLGAAVVPTLVNKLYPLAFENTNGTAGTMSETFDNTNIRGKAASAAIGIDNHDVPRVLVEIQALNKQTPFPGVLGLRFVQRTKATLGFTRFPVTAVLEFDGVEGKVTRKFLEQIWARLEALNINYTLHWGKINFNLTPARLRKMYGDTAVNQWLSSRQRLLDAPTRRVFTNAFMERCGLDKDPVPSTSPVA